MKRRKKKYYLVVSKIRKFTHGAFPHTEEGLDLAKKYVRKISKASEEEFLILEK